MENGYGLVPMYCYNYYNGYYYEIPNPNLNSYYGYYVNNTSVQQPIEQHVSHYAQRPAQNFEPEPIFLQSPTLTSPYCAMPPPVQFAKVEKKDVALQTIDVPLPKNYWEDETFLNCVFAKLSTQELLRASLVSQKWHSIAKAHLKKITHLKISSPSPFYGQLWPCMHLPGSSPCSRKQYFFTKLVQYNYRHKYDNHFARKEILNLYEQIDLIVNRLQGNNTITTLDLFGCPRLGSALSYLLSSFSENLECLSLNRVACLGFYSYHVWRLINMFLPKLKKLALLQIGYVPTDMPVLEQLEEFHLAATTMARIEPYVVTELLLQLGTNLRKLSLNLTFPSACLVQWHKASPDIVANVTHLELYAKAGNFSFNFVSKRFTSLTHLSLLLPDRKSLYLEVFHDLPQLSALQYLQLTEDSRLPNNRLMSTLNEHSPFLTPLSSIKVLHLEVALTDYREVSCLHTLFPNMEEIVLKSLSFDSDCICSQERPNFRIELTECETCCDNLKAILFSGTGKLRKVLGIESDAYYDEQYPKEDWSKCRYKWL